MLQCQQQVKFCLRINNPTTSQLLFVNNSQTKLELSQTLWLNQQMKYCSTQSFTIILSYFERKRFKLIDRYSTGNAVYAVMGAGNSKMFLVISSQLLGWSGLIYRKYNSGRNIFMTTTFTLSSWLISCVNLWRLYTLPVTASNEHLLFDVYYREPL